MVLAVVVDIAVEMVGIVVVVLMMVARMLAGMGAAEVEWMSVVMQLAM